MTKDRFGAPILAVEGQEGRILALLSLAYGKLVQPSVIRHFKNASRALARGERNLAQIHLCFAGLPRFTGDDARLKLMFQAEQILDDGLSPGALMKGLGLLPDEVSGEDWPAFIKASPDDPVHPGYPKGEPDGRGGQFRPKTDDERAQANGHYKRLFQAARAAINAARVAAPLLKPAERHPLIVAAVEGLGIAADAVAPYVDAYFDDPQTLANLQANANSPKTGYDVHHIVEQATAADDGSEDDLINDPDNLVRIPTLKHWELNSWYQTQNEDYGDMTPRTHATGKSWEERRAIGLNGLREVGVLK